MSGVRNLRAMFEQKNDQGNSPPSDRGRSPGPGLPSFGSPTPSSRPLSKVRTNFVAVEKDGRIGLQRQHSGDSVSVSSRRLSNETESTTPAPLSEKNDPFVDNMAKNTASFKTNLANEPIPESPSLGSPVKLSPTKCNQTPDMIPGPDPDKFVDEEETETKLTSADPTILAHVNGKAIGLDGTTDPKEKAKNATLAGKSTTKATAPISTSAKTTTKPLRSPLTAKPPKSPAKEAAKASEKKATSSSTTKDNTPKTAAAKPMASSAKKSGAVDLSPSTNLVKPKPKSPTRAVKLPSGLTAPTSASASKLGGSAPPPRRSLSRASGNLGVSASSQRSTSRASTSTAAASSGKTLRRQASTINRPRPSIGPPPKLPAKDHPPTRKETNVDEGFLARMMRPTQSSSSKTLDKAPVTPPRKRAVAATIKKPVTKDVEGSAKKAATNIVDSAKKDSSVKKSTAAKAEVKEAAQASVAKPVKPTTTKEVVPIAAQTESNETAGEAATTSADTILSPIVTVEKQQTARSTTPESEPPEAETGKEMAAEPTPQTLEPPAVAETTVPEVEEHVVAHEPKIVEPTSSREPEIVEESKLADGRSFSSEADEGIPLSTGETKNEEVVSNNEDGKVTSMEHLPALSADPEKVEGIEDVEQPVERTD